MIANATPPTSRTRRLLCLGLTFLTLGIPNALKAESFPPVKLPDMAGKGLNVQRTMRLLAESTAEKPNTVRILFYGQSITEQAWWKLVVDDLKARFPHARIVAENRALAGYSSQLLVRSVMTDVVPFQPDLLIFHVYGAHDKYEEIIKLVRQHTAAEILQQNDHVTKAEQLTEEMDPAKVPIQAGKWDAFMNHNWLPSISRKYGTEFCDQRAIWKQYLTDNKLEPQALLRDNVHLNAHGEFVMAECVKAYLRRDPKLGASPAEAWVQQGMLQRQGDSLKVEFEGATVEIVVGGSASLTADALKIDGQPVADIPVLKGFSRALGKPGYKWPVIAPIGSQVPLLLEEWTMDVKRADAETDPKKMKFTFSLTGSQTGPDGSGSSDQKFTSNSGRVVIEPDAWGIPYGLMLAGVKTVPETLTVKWKAEPRYGVSVPSQGPASSSIWLVQGLPNQKHTLEITKGASAVQEVRVRRPPLAVK